ncbi:hypothetical protein N0V82_007595 [Gnomoniopsis sp. IMI 355080]|nr:hypothetical protein N0V82_007595 [Gnomoniopsis sp. IMI 355080]
MEVLPNTTASISVADCRKVLENTRYNKGYYEVWGFDNDNYAPITGYQSCVFAVARMDAVVPGGYAVIGNDDVVSAVAEVIGGHTKGGVVGSAGVWRCGPNGVNLQLIVYNGLEGWHGDSSRDAPIMNMYGDWSPTVTATVAAPTVTNVPTETPVKKNMTWEQPRLVYRHF